MEEKERGVSERWTALHRDRGEHNRGKPINCFASGAEGDDARSRCAPVKVREADDENKRKTANARATQTRWPNSLERDWW